MRLTLSYIFLTFLIACTTSETSEPSWEVAGGNPERQQFSGVTSITPSNVDQMAVAWIYRTGGTHKGSQIQCNPIIVGDRLFGTGAALTLFCIQADSGEERWVFDPSSSLGKDDYSPGMNVNRGVTYWTDGYEERILFVVGPYLFSIDAKTGEPDLQFGSDGKVDLHDGLGRDVSNLFVTATSPGVIYKDLFILGSRVSEGKDAAPGHIRAFDVKDGALKWVFHTIPQPGETGYDSWEDPKAYTRVGGANAWSGFSLDRERGLVFAATGSASFDFYGGDRKGDNLFANSTIALDASTGEYQWHFQTIHHDVWDRDLPAPPVLAELKTPAGPKPVAVQLTKTGFVFVMDRETGKPVYPIEEVPVPAESPLIDEKLSPTQPMPTTLPPFMRQSMAVEDINQFIPDSSRQKVIEQFLSYNSGHIYTPPSEEGSVFFPGLDGGAEWGGSSFDQETSILYINSNEIPWVMTNVQLNEGVELSGKSVYQGRCMACHGTNLEGAGNYPALVDVEIEEEDFRNLLKNGRRMMPAFAYLSEDEVSSLVDYVLNYDSNAAEDEDAAGSFSGYTVAGYTKFQTPEGLPAISPPWGRLTAMDLEKGEIKWQVPLGEYPGLDSLGIVTGTENYGGPIATSGGLVFIAATMDGKIRAFDKETGEKLWEDELPVPGYATPAMYEINGKPYLVIACGGGKLGSPSGDYYIAYSIPQSIQ